MMTNKIVSSLTDEELRKLADDYQEWSAEGFAKQVANAAAQKSIGDLKVPNKDWFEAHGWGEEWRHSPLVSISDYLKDLKEGKL